MKRKLFAVMVALAGIFLLGATFLPIHNQEIEIALPAQSASGPADVLAGRLIHLTLPEDLPSGESVLVQLDLPAGAARSGSPNLIEGRLDLPGAQVFPAAQVTAPFTPERPVSFRWLVTGGDDDPLPGRIWLTLVAGDGAGELRIAVLARPVELRVRRLVGITLPEARRLGGILAASGLALLVILWLAFNRKRARKTQATSK